MASSNKPLHPSEKHPHFDHLPRPLVVMENRWPAGTSTGWHTHPTGQLLYATEGVMLVNTDAGSWVVTPNRALWMLPRLRHNVTMSGDVLIRTAYIDVAKVPTLPLDSCVMNVSPLLRELLVEAVHFTKRGTAGPRRPPDRFAARRNPHVAGAATAPADAG